MRVQITRARQHSKPRSSLSRPAGRMLPVQAKAGKERVLDRGCSSEGSESVSRTGTGFGGLSVFPLPAGPSSGGTKLPAPLRRKMESAFRADFSQVRVHRDAPDANSLSALAFTQGRDIHFAPGVYNPNSREGQKIIGHELAHVVQQSRGRTPAPRSSAIPLVANRSLEAEADALGTRAAQGVPTGLFGQEPGTRFNGGLDGMSPIQPMLRGSGDTGRSGRPPVLERDEGAPANWVKTPTGQVIEVSADHKLGWGQSFVSAPTSAPAPTSTPPATAPPPRTTVSTTSPPPSSAPAPVGSASTSRATGSSPDTTPARTFPRGFRDEQHFRDVTRVVAEQNRDARIIVRGSSVTGQSATTGRPFRSGGSIAQNSDVDVGIVSRDLRSDPDSVTGSGFPLEGTDLSSAERLMAASLRPSGHHTGVKVFSSTPRGEVIERPHTPPRDRRRPVDVNSVENQRTIEEERRRRRGDSRRY